MWPLLPIVKPGTSNASTQTSLSNCGPDFPALEPGKRIKESKTLLKPIVISLAVTYFAPKCFLPQRNRRKATPKCAPR